MPVWSESCSEGGVKAMKTRWWVVISKVEVMLHSADDVIRP